MIGDRDRELAERLRELRAPDEASAEERSWPIVREAYSQRTRVQPSRPRRRLALAVAGGLLVIAVGLSPAGAKVGDLVSDVVGISGEDAKPELRSLPAAGELLVESDAGVWIVRDDGSKRLLGVYEEAAWSPRGRYVAVADGSELLALDPTGEVQWAIPTAGAPRDIAWEGTELDTRIAYRAGGDLFVVGGNGSENRLIARDIGPGAPLWIETAGPTKVDPAGSSGFPYLLAFIDRSGEARVVQPDAGAPIEFDLGPADLSALRGEVALDPVAGNRRVARVERDEGRSTLLVGEGGRERVVFSGQGRITDPVWSPDGRWLLFGWRDADQWVFIQPDRPRDVTAIQRISRQFDPPEGGAADFPRVGGWVLPQR